jgi:hypothetical protein
MPRRRGEQRAQMTFKRLIACAAVVAFLALPAASAADDSGGVPAQPVSGHEGGGVLAPAGAPSAEASASDSDPAPPAEPAQTPTTPEGEEQPPDKENGEEQPPDEEENGEETPPGDDGGSGGGTAGGLPRTGFELLALTMIGLGLLLAGGALWPTSSWPPPRDRLSRSTPRRR